MINYELLNQKREEIKQEVLDKLKISNRVGVVQYTGFGKSYLMIDLCKELSGRKVVIEPTTTMRDQIKSNLDKKHNTDVVLYGFISSKSHLVLDTVFNNVEYLFIDECHRTFSKKFKQKLDYILKRYPDIKIAGFTATPNRTDGINVVNSFFTDKVSELTLADALENKFVDDITYISAYADPKCALEGTNLGNLKRVNLENVYRIPEIFKRRIDKDEYIENKNFKVLLFVSRLAYIDTISENIIKWFNEAFPNKKVNTYLLKSNVGDDLIHNFENNNNINEIDILISVNRLVEGKHINGARCAMLFRKTVSGVVFNQQVGRVTHSKRPIIFDFVENFHNVKEFINELNSIKQLAKGEYTRKTTKEYKYEEPITNKIIVIDETKEIREIIHPYKGISKEDKEWIIKNSKNYTRKQLYDLFEDKYENRSIHYFITENKLEIIRSKHDSGKVPKEDVSYVLKILNNNLKEIETMKSTEINKKFFNNKYKKFGNFLNKHNISYSGSSVLSENQKNFINSNINNMGVKSIATTLHKSQDVINKYLEDNNLKLKSKYVLINNRKLKNKVQEIIINNKSLSVAEIKEIIFKELKINISVLTIQKYKRDLKKKGQLK